VAAIVSAPCLGFGSCVGVDALLSQPTAQELQRIDSRWLPSCSPRVAWTLAMLSPERLLVSVVVGALVFTVTVSFAALVAFAVGKSHE
jgi:hypothetical protein